MSDFLRQTMTCTESFVICFLNLVLVGLSGVGKSAAGNTILGREVFKSGASPSSLTRKSERREREVCGRRVCAVDTPGLFNTELSEEELRNEMQRAEELCDPGPHAFLLVIQLGRFTQQEKRVMEMLQEIFSERVTQSTLVLFTYGDRLKNKTIEEFIRHDSNLQQLLQKCGNRYHVFNNQDTSNSDQVKILLKKIDGMLDNEFPSSDMRKEKNIKNSGIVESFVSFVPLFAKVLFATVVGTALAGGSVRVIMGAGVGCASGLVWWILS